MHLAIIIGTVRSLIVDMAMGQIPRSIERISSSTCFYVEIFQLSITLPNVSLNSVIIVALVLIIIIIIIIMAVCCVSVVVNCPVDNIKLSIVVSNLAVAEQIGELLVHCRYGVEPILTNSDSAVANDCTEQYQVNPHGCPITVRVSARRYVLQLHY